MKAKRKTLIFIGTYLSKHAQNPTQAEILINKLNKLVEIKISSTRINPVFRLLEMMFIVLKNQGRDTIVLIDTYSHFAFIYAIVISVICRILRIKYIPILRGGNLPKSITQFPNISKYIFNGALLNISPSEYIKKKCNRIGILTHTISNFIDIEQYSYKARKILSPKILWVRSFHKSYNPIMAIHTLNTLKKKYPSAILTMIGPDKDGSLNLCKNLVRDLNLNDSIYFKGYMKKTDWIDFSKDFDVFINTTNYDNMPVSIIEAMALGFPIVSTEVGGIKYLLDDGIDSFLVPKNNTNMMVEKIIKLIKNPVLAYQFSQNSREKALRFTWNNVKKEWLDILGINK